eukprot:4405063-Alexandrium_andersonii.AAC.1
MRALNVRPTRANRSGLGQKRDGGATFRRAENLEPAGRRQHTTTGGDPGSSSTSAPSGRKV